MVFFATTTAVDREQLLDVARERHHDALVTTRRDGRPQVSPVLIPITVDSWGPVATGGFPPDRA